MTTMSMRAFETPNYEPLKAILRAFTYRPDWSFEIVYGAIDTLVIQGRVIDTDDFSKVILLNFSASLPEAVRPDFDWTCWLFDRIMEVERHEAQEFFKINGVKVYDPHA